MICRFVADRGVFVHLSEHYPSSIFLALRKGDAIRISFFVAGADKANLIERGTEYAVCRASHDGYFAVVIFIEKSKTLFPTLAELAELILENIDGIDRTPRQKVVVGKARHSCGVSARLGEEQARWTRVLRTFIERLNMEWEFAESLREELFGFVSIGDFIGMLVKILCRRCDVVAGIASERPAEQQMLNALIAERADMIVYQRRNGDRGDR